MKDYCWQRLIADVLACLFLLPIALVGMVIFGLFAPVLLFWLWLGGYGNDDFLGRIE